MNHQMSFKEYRSMDLLIFSALTVVFEYIVTLATAKWFAGQPVAISITLTLVLITIHRWGAYAAVVALLGGVAFCIASGASWEHYLIYAIGNLFALVSLVYFKPFDQQDIKKSFFKTLLFAVTAYLSVALGRWLVSLAFGAGGGELIAFLTTDLITLLFAVVILYSCKSVDGLIEDQASYIVRIHEAEKSKHTSELDG